MHPNSLSCPCHTFSVGRRVKAAINQATKSRQLDDPDGCPVCLSIGPQPFLLAEGRDYWRCGICEARFLDPRQLPSRAAEQQRYL